MEVVFTFCQPNLKHAKYSKYYSGQEPQFIEGDVFRIIVPLDDDYSFDFGQHEHVNQLNQSDQLNQTDLSEDEIILLNLIKEHPDMTNSLLAETLGWSISRVKYYIPRRTCCEVRIMLRMT